jgi:hypothetical protein
MLGLDPSIHANTTLVEFAWIPGTRPGMTVVVLMSFLEGRQEAVFLEHFAPRKQRPRRIS